MSSPQPPTPARTKKRVLNLVNPADPQEFSQQSTSPTGSPNSSPPQSIQLSQKEKASPPFPILPRLSELQHSHSSFGTPNGAKKGILRSSGTPGSGNGVRFFPKNKFRVITPNASIITETPVKPAPNPSPTSSSFFSQLLAVTMSPRRKEPEPEPETVEDESVEVDADGSWEKPGEEGEISLIHSTGSGTSMIINSDEEEEDEDQVDEETWDGQPEVHCSPLGLPIVPDGNTSRDMSYGELELPSAEWSLPADMSNLLSTRFSEKGSFSMNDHPTDSMIESPDSESATHTFAQQQAAPSLAASSRSVRKEARAEADFWGVQHDESTMSALSREDSNPTIRADLQLSPLKDPLPLHEPENPTLPSPVAPAPSGQAFLTSSIFADMSAEQAELTWPLTRRANEDDTLSSMHSPARIASPVASPNQPVLQMETPKAGDVTQFFDCTMLSPPATSPLAHRSTSAPLPNLPTLLAHPTEKLLAAQTAHTQALTNELALYRSLADRLQAEVVERDEVLGKMNLRMLDMEVVCAQVGDLRNELREVRVRAEVAEAKAKAGSGEAPPGMGSPSPMTRTRSSEGASEIRDLEIRLAKAVSDSAHMSRQLEEVKRVRDQQAAELAEARAEARDAEDREKSRMVKVPRFEDEREEEGEMEELRQGMKELQQKVEEMEEEEEELALLREEAEQLRAELEEIRKPSEEVQRLREKVDLLRDQLDQATEHTEEAQALRAELSSAHHQLVDLESQSSELSELQAEIQTLRTHLAEMKEVKAADEEEIEHLVGQVDKLREERRETEGWKREMDDMKKRIEIESGRKAEVGELLEEHREISRKVEAENRELRKSLQTTREQLVHAQSGPTTDPSLEASLQAEINRLRAQSASKDLEIHNLTRRKVELKEDREMLNIALDSKQQEVELMKRKFGVRGVAGSSALTASQRTNMLSENATPKGLGTSTATTCRRRSSLMMQTPLPGGVRASKRNSLETPLALQGSNRHGVQLYPSTKMPTRVLRRDGEENVPPVPGASVARHGSLRRKEREMTLA
ncbi:hypothetical protein L198_06156 [Cryptococcus wingfieldii CBS 7118]|uniref:Uncharacterized protein n=1 Tax=Cryptococcus wingfieldii CBS 7118 TaxID=1295528 RepID=A0A1E3IQG9_9TREE|nr:hypothetical protein L198_06156 [Cryptococcus wingfieldii CBS 7118]ODN90839.1 hypothetical protein L198_06156 [Cryptococcus wingfieldii CBS 7118]